KGHLRFVLEGKKLAGAWSLVRMGKPAGAGKENWLLIKSRDEQANGRDIVTEKPQSVDSGKSIEEIENGKLRIENAKTTNDAAKSLTPKRPGRSKAAPRAKISKSQTLPDFLEPQLATLVDQVPGGDDWLHEVKLDGYRTLCR